MDFATSLRLSLRTLVVVLVQLFYLVSVAGKPTSRRYRSCLSFVCVVPLRRILISESLFFGSTFNWSHGCFPTGFSPL
ncbi:hypothetical protein C8F04DRAFT_1118207, partial [Mycena alexandri]